MKTLLLLILISMQASAQTIASFNNESKLKNWYVINDGVMGGLSKGKLQLTENGHGKFYGTVSLENNGGFASIRHDLGKTAATANLMVRLCIKGDGKEYQFRVKHDSNAYYSYITTFKTTGTWEAILIPLSSFYPSYRGRTLDLPNYNHNSITELTFLIGNKKAESFELLIDKIELIEP